MSLRIIRGAITFQQPCHQPFHGRFSEALRRNDHSVSFLFYGPDFISVKQQLGKMAVTAHASALPLTVPSCQLRSSIDPVLSGWLSSRSESTSDAWQRREIDDKPLQRMLLFAICPAPSFVIVTVGCYFLCNQMLGCLLYGAQVLSVLFLALVSSVPASVQSKQKLSRTLFQGECLPYDHALVEAVLFSSRTLLGMCGYIVFFAVLSSLLAQFPLPTEVLTISSAALEISGACGKLAVLSIPHRLSVLSFFLSFGGLSVQFQLKSILGNCPCSFLRLFLGRIAHGLCSAVFTELLLSAFPQTAAVFSADASPLPLSNASTPLLSLCLIGMICILLNGSQRKVAAKE